MQEEKNCKRHKYNSGLVVLQNYNASYKQCITIDKSRNQFRFRVACG